MSGSRLTTYESRLDPMVCFSRKGVRTHARSGCTQQNAALPCERGESVDCATKPARENVRLSIKKAGGRKAEKAVVLRKRRRSSRIVRSRVAFVAAIRQSGGYISKVARTE